MPATDRQTHGTYDAGLVYSPDRARPHTLSRSDAGEICTVAGWVHQTAEPVCIIFAESSGKTDARSKNPDGNENIGIFQIDGVNVQHPEHLLDPVYSANVAYRMWREDGGTFTKRWATAPQCAGKTGNEPLADEAKPVGASADLGNIGNAVAGALAAVLNSIPWFRVGKGALGFVFIVVGVGTLVVVVANKTPSPARTVRRALR
jgi:hypothetical protein